VNKTADIIDLIIVYFTPVETLRQLVPAGSFFRARPSSRADSLLPPNAEESYRVMAIRPIIHFPDERLHQIAEPVGEVTDEIRELVRDMAETMYAAPGIGLAATQLDIHKRVIVIDISETRDQLLVLIDPEIISKTGSAMYKEGCLSVPGVYEPVERAERVTVRAKDRDGQIFELEAEGVLGVCIQHEIDHLHGRVFVEYLSRLKQFRIRARLRKVDRKKAAACA
jgi:peptide deformylase